jgi:fucose 4-O-acetylase-like acetyltransferase
MTSSHERRYDLDWLRVLAVLLLVPFHVALIFVLDPNSIMYIKDVLNSRALDEAAGFVHMWHMPVLFIVSGAATYFALGFRSAGQYLRERFLRLLVPFLFGVLTFIPFTTYIRRIGTVSLWEHYAGFFRFDLEHLDGYSGTPVVHPVPGWRLKGSGVDWAGPGESDRLGNPAGARRLAEYPWR